ncbi:MAG: hypothetical protein NC184_06365 [Roseburia sp.]|nr:hypothetical protein [Roseburia sp.]
MLDKEISELLAYAQAHLLMDELDENQAARRICRLLKTDGYVKTATDPDEIDACFSPNRLLEPILKYAVEQGITDENGVAAFKSEIMDALMLKPSEVNDLFADTYAVNKQKAFDWLYDYSVKDGYVDLEACARNDRWEAKELKSKIEIIINLMPQAKPDKYPQCALCKENEGYGDRVNMRAVATEICGEEWHFTYSRHQYFDRHGVLVNGEHTPMKGGKDTLKKLGEAADFIGADGFVGANALAENGGANITAHEHFQTGFRSTPMLRAGIKKKLKSAEYPYLDIGLVDWYSTVLRFSYSGLEKCTEFADKLITAWKAYSDERIVNPDGKMNFCNVVCRKIDGKYCFDVMLRSNALKRPRTAAEYDEIKAGALSLTDMQGVFVLPNKLSEQLKEVQSYLDGTIPFDAKDTKKPLEKMIERLLKAQGGTVSKLEAKLNIHDEVDAVCEKILASTAVFDEHTVTPFLDSLGIRVL